MSNNEMWLLSINKITTEQWKNEKMFLKNINKKFVDKMRENNVDKKMKKRRR